MSLFKRYYPVLVAVLVAVLPFGMNTYWTEVAVNVGLYALLALSLNVILGQAGIFHMGHAAFYAVGAYVTAILNTHYQIPILLLIPVAGAAAALREAGIVAMTPCTEFTLSCSYNQYGRVSALVPECGGVIEHTDFAGDVTLRCYLRPEAFPHFQRTLADATNGQVSPVVFGENFVAFPVEAENN